MKKKTTLSEQFQNPNEKSYKEAKSITHIYITAHFPIFVKALQ